MSPILVFRSTHLLPSIDFCNQNGLSYKSAFRTYKLPLLLEPTDDIYLPWTAGCNALDQIASNQAVPDMAARIAINLTLDDFGEAMAAPIKSSPSLFQALLKLNYLIKAEDNTTSIKLYYEKETCWIKATSLGMHYDCNAWMNLSFLISAVRAFVGDRWYPSLIALANKAKPSFYIQSHFPDTRFIYNPNGVGFAFPKSFLSTLPLNPINIPVHPVLESEPFTIEYTVKSVIKSYLKEGDFGIDFISNQLGLNTRTLQRRLKSQGFGYAQILDNIRYERACHLLKTTDLKVKDIAVEVGFSDASHFIRFFKRIACTPPIEYRNTVKSP